jgi:tetratricopeptide (TPR) repeat protein
VKAKMKDYPGAIADYDQAIALDRDFGDAYIGRGQARRESGDEAGALADLDHAITGGRKLYHYKNGFRLMPHYAAIFRKLGWAGWNDDTPPAAYLARGRLWLDKADYERARPDLEYAAHHSIDNPDALVYFGLELLATQQCDDGERTLDKAAEMMGTARATLVQAHRAFIAKTPCAGDLLE